MDEQSKCGRDRQEERTGFSLLGAFVSSLQQGARRTSLILFSWDLSSAGEELTVVVFSPKGGGWSSVPVCVCMNSDHLLKLYTVHKHLW